MQNKTGSSLIGKIDCYLQIVNKDPHSTAFVPLAEAFRQVGLLDDALAAARLGTQALPNFSPGFATLGRVLCQMGKFDEAMTAYYQALAIDRQSLAALLGLARLHLILCERDQARRILTQAIEFHPQDEMLGNMLLALDLPKPWATAAAPAPVAEVVAVVPDEITVAPGEVSEEPGSAPIPTATLAEIYVKQGLIEQAVRVYEEIQRLEPGNAGVMSRLLELRGSLAGQMVAAPEPEVVAPPAETPVAVEEKAAPPREPRIVFERWLQAIALRRAHVQ